MSQETNTVAWWRLLNRYQWFVLIVAAAGWLLDCMDQQLFNLARTPAMKELLKDTFAPGASTDFVHNRLKSPPQSRNTRAIRRPYSSSGGPPAG